MKTYALLFAWVFVFLAYAPGGNISEAPVFWTLALIGLAVDIIGALAKYHADVSELRIIRGYALDQANAFRAGNARAFTVSCSAMGLFETRGAA